MATAAELAILIKARDEASAVFRKVQQSAGGFGSKIAGVAKTAAFALGGVAVAAGGIAAATIGAASDLNESLSKVDVVFGKNADTVKKWASTSATAFGQSKQQALEAAGTYGNLFQAFGIGQQAATDMSTSLVGLAADLASFNNTSVDDALIALRSGLSGETEPLKRYGVAINDARLKQEALAMGLISSTKEALDPAAKAQAAYALIMKDTTLAQGDFARTSGGLANQQRILKAVFTDLKASIGQIFLPILTAILPSVSRGLQKVSVVVQEFVGALTTGKTIDEGTPIERFALRVRAVLLDVREQVGFFFDTLRTGLTDQDSATKLESFALTLRAMAQTFRDDVLPILIRIGAVVRDELAPRFVLGLQTIGDALRPVFEYVTTHKEAMIAAIIAIGAAIVIAIGPGALAIAAIFGLITAIGYIRENWDDIKAKTIEIWNSIDQYLQEHFGGLRQLAIDTFNGIKMAIEDRIRIVRDVINIVMALIKGDWGEAWENIKKLPGDVLTLMKHDIQTRLQLLRDVFDLAFTAIKSAIISPMQAAVNFVINNVINPIIDGVNKVKDGINAISPGNPAGSHISNVPTVGAAEHQTGSGWYGGIGGGGHFAGGGWVPGVLGRAVPIMAHAGEYVLSRDMLAGRSAAAPSADRALDRASAPSVTIYVEHAHFEGDPVQALAAFGLSYT